MNENNVTRRTFLKTSAAAGAIGVIGTGGLFTSCAGGSRQNERVPLRAPGTYYVPKLPDIAPDGREIKAGIIGCGGRGSGAAFNFLDAANNVTITALGDAYLPNANQLAERLADQRGIIIPPEKRFSGLDAYKQVIDSGVDVIIDCVPPVFRPEIFRYAVENNVHCFLEKPICVDALGYRTVIAAARLAQARRLTVVTGTQRHHQRSYVASFQQIMDGAIGEITGGVVYWNQSQLWFRERQPGQSDFEAMVRDWVNWRWLSGDHIVEQHHHNIDVFMWFSGLRPTLAVGNGSRHRRVTGDQYDNFNIDFRMENGIHLHSMCRQIDGCANNVSEFIQGTKGSWMSNGHVIRDLEGNEIWRYDDAAAREIYSQHDPYTLEHVDMISSIRENRGLEQATETAISNMAAIMGREAAYTGQEITWEAMSASPQDFMPADLSLTGRMDMSRFTVPVPGTGR